MRNIFPVRVDRDFRLPCGWPDYPASPDAFRVLGSSLKQRVTQTGDNLNNRRVPFFIQN